MPGFWRASEDRFFLVLSAEEEDPRFGLEAATRFLEGLRPLRVAEVPREGDMG